MSRLQQYSSAPAAVVAGEAVAAAAGGPVEKPILFSAPMVRAILAGTKTQTRRLFRLPPWLLKRGADLSRAFADKAFGVTPCLKVPYDFTPGDAAEYLVERVRNPWMFAKPGDVRLVVREAWQYADWTEDGYPFIGYRADGARRLVETAGPDWADRLSDEWAKLSAPENFAIDGRAADRRWRPGIHMPWWASRITLEVTDVRAERLNDITEADADAEGVEALDGEMNDARLCARAKAMGITADDSRAWFAELWDGINGERASWTSNPWVWAVTFRRVTS